MQHSEDGRARWPHYRTPCCNCHVLNPAIERSQEFMPLSECNLPALLRDPYAGSRWILGRDEVVEFVFGSAQRLLAGLTPKSLQRCPFRMCKVCVA